MIIIEVLYKAKKRIKKIYNDYFTINGQYTSLLPDKIYLKKLYKKRTGKELNLKNPITYNDKLNWIKLYDRNPQYTILADKYAVREYVKEKIGVEYLIPLIGVWDSVEEIDFDSLPKRFVLKCNHDNGVIICQDKSLFDIEKAKREITYHFNRNYYKKCREWPYKNIKRKITCEKYMEDRNQPTLMDYKFFCFNGEPRLIYVAQVISGELCINFFDMSFNSINISRRDHPCFPKDYEIEKPKELEKMISIARKLSNGIPSIRVDLYNIDNKIYFGELTFFTAGGFIPVVPEKWDRILGDWIELPKKRRR